jgi:hypothetical protein
MQHQAAKGCGFKPFPHCIIGKDRHGDVSLLWQCAASAARLAANPNDWDAA